MTIFLVQSFLHGCYFKSKKQLIISTCVASLYSTEKKSAKCIINDLFKEFFPTQNNLYFALAKSKKYLVISSTVLHLYSIGKHEQNAR